MRDDFAKLGKVPPRSISESEADNFVAGKAVNDVIERSIKKDFAVINNEDPIAQLGDVLHVMAGQHCDDAMLRIVNPQKLAYPLLTHDVEPDCRFIKKKNARLVNERAD